MYSEDVQSVQDTLENIHSRSPFTIRKLQPELRQGERFLLLHQVLDNLSRFLENRDTASYHSQKNAIIRLQLTPDEPFYGKIDTTLRQLETIYCANKGLLRIIHFHS